MAERWFDRHGQWTVFFSRLLPVVRTFISVPAGVARMPVWQFSAYTFAGSFPWSLGLAWAGFQLGQNWEDIRNWMRPADIPIVVIALLLIALYVYRHVRRAWTEEPESQGSKVQEGR
jgi:membrane protein DedA with SNARE-associated domain